MEREGAKGSPTATLRLSCTPIIGIEKGKRYLLRPQSKTLGEVPVPNLAGSAGFQPAPEPTRWRRYSRLLVSLLAFPSPLIVPIRPGSGERPFVELSSEGIVRVARIDMNFQGVILEGRGGDLSSAHR